MIDLDEAASPLIPDVLDAIADALGVRNMNDSQREGAAGVLIQFARLAQRDTLAAVISSGVSSGFAGATGAKLQGDGPPAPKGASRPFSRDEHGNVSFQKP